MSLLSYPWSLLLVALAGWINRHQQAVIEVLKTENRVLREQLGGKRLRLTDDQRRRLAANGKALGRKVLAEVATIVTPDTILAWYRKLIARKWTQPKSPKHGRPGIAIEIRELIICMARQNPGWGYTRLMGALANLGHDVGRGTIARVLKENGIEPAPERGRKTAWRTFLKAHWGTIAAADFFTVEAWTRGGLVTHYVLFVIDLATRRVHLAGVTANPDRAWMNQIARNLTDAFEGFLRDKRYLIMDRDDKFSEAFRFILQAGGVKAIRLPCKSPNLNAFAERWVLSVKCELLDRMIFFGRTFLMNALREYLAHYHQERNHQGLDNRLIESPDYQPVFRGPVRCRERLGGYLRFYYLDAA